MAKAEAKPEAGEEAPKKKGKLLIIIVAVVFLIVAGGGAALFMMKSHDGGDDEDAPSETVKKKKSEKEEPPVYVALDTFTVNLVPDADAGDQYLQIGVSVELTDVPSGEKMKLHMPRLRNAVMLLLSSKKASDLMTTEGKEALAKDMKEQMNGILSPETKGKDGPVKDVLFTSFIIQ